MSEFVFSRKPITIDRGSGVYLYDTDGNEFLDAGASYACTPIGHCHPAVVDAIEEQASRLLYVQGSYPTPPRDALVETLSSLGPGSCRNVWLCNSGTEANEAAIKFARSATGNEKIIATTRAFHGRTMGALAATWRDKYRDPFEPVMPGVEFVPYNDADALNDAVDDDTAAVILEPVQGEGGVHPADSRYLQQARTLTAETGAALILDEIQTGLGRTGTFWACEQADIVPDILTSAKGIASGLPLGTVLCQDWIAEESGPHGSTFSGNPLVAAAAQATLTTIIENDVPAHAAEIGSYLAEELLEKDLDVREIRGRGLLIGIEVKRGANRLLPTLAMEHGILALPAGRSVLRLLPPLTIDRAEATQLLDGLTAVMEGTG